MILETHESSPQVDVQTVIEEIMKQAVGGELPVSFRHGPEPDEEDQEIVFLATAGHPSKTAARVRADLQDTDWEIVSVDDGWIIRKISTYADWSEYWANAETMTADDIGYTVLVSTADMTRFCRGTVYREWASPLGLGVPVMFGGEGTPLAKGQEDAPTATDTSNPEVPTKAHEPEPSDKQEKPQRNRKRDAKTDAILKTRIETVKAAARTKWPKKQPGFRTMAKHLESTHGKKLGFKFEAIRQILKGTYPASKNLGIPGL